MKKTFLFVLSVLMCLLMLASCTTEIADLLGNNSGSTAAETSVLADTTKADTTEIDTTEALTTEAETTAEDTTVSETTEAKGDAPFELTFYTDPKSENFTALGDKVTALDGCYDAAEDDKIRFISSADGVNVTLEAVGYYPELDYFRSYMPVFETVADADTVYEFAASLAETIPEYRITAEKDGFCAVWLLKEDGRNADSVFDVAAEKTAPPVPDEDSPVTKLCKVYGYCSMVSDSDLKSIPDYYWNTLSQAVCQVNGKFNDGTLRQEEWLIEAYQESLFPEKEFPEIQSWYSIEYTTEYHERYIVSADFSDIGDVIVLNDTKIIDENTVELEFKLIITEAMAVPEHLAVGDHICMLTLSSDVPPDNPFGWKIIDYNKNK